MIICVCHGQYLLSVPMSRDVVLKYLEKWKNSLLDRTKRNPLVNYKPSRVSSIILKEPGTEEIISKLMEDKKLKFYIPPEKNLPDDYSKEDEENWRKKWPKRKRNEVMLHHEESRKCRSAINNLRRKNLNAVNDLGFHVLYLASGFIRWYNPNDKEKIWNKSPLFLCEAQIDSPRGDFQSILSLHDHEWTLNPTIEGLFKADFGVDLGDLSENVPSPHERFEEILERVRGAVPEAELLDELVIDIFQFKKERIYRDLENNSSLIIDHPFIKAICNTGSSHESTSMSFDSPRIEDLDQTDPPEKMHNIMDADSSQLLSIIACRDGHSFVMDGPPGTGKSQSIANMIAEMLALGKKVLFVSEKAAALEVVQNRLTSNSLGDYTLAIHDENATSKKFVEELHRSLNRHPVPPADRFKNSDLVERRARLSEHSLRMNRFHEDMETSLIDAIGRSLSHRDIPLLPPIERESGQISLMGLGLFSKKSLDDSIRAANKIVDEWEVFSLGDENPWKYCKERKIEASDRFAIKRTLEAFVSRSQEFLDAIASSSSMLNIDKNPTFNQYSELSKFLEGILNLRKDGVPAMFLYEDKFSLIKKSFSELMRIQDEVRGLEEASPIRIFESQRSRIIEDVENHALRILELSESEIIDSDSRVEAGSFSVFLTNIDHSLKSMKKLEGVVKDFSKLLNGKDVSKFKLKTVSDMSIIYRLIIDSCAPFEGWLDAKLQRKISPMARDCKRDLMLHEIEKSILLEDFNSRILEQEIFDDCGVILETGLLRRLSREYRNSKKRIISASKDGRMPRKDRIKQILDFHVVHRNLDERLTSGDWSPLANEKGIESISPSIIERRISGFDALLRLKSEGFSTSDLLPMLNDEDGRHLGMIDELERINTLFESIEELLSIDPLILDMDSDINNYSRELENIRYLYEENSEQTANLLEVEDRSNRSVSVRSIHKSLENLKKIIAFDNRIEDINSELNEADIDISPIYHGVDDKGDSGTKVIDFIDGLLVEQKSSFDADTVSEILEGQRLEEEIRRLDSLSEEYNSSFTTFQIYFDLERRFMGSEISNIDLRDVENFSNSLNDSFGEIEANNRLNEALENVAHLGLMGILNDFQKLGIPKERLPDAFERALLDIWIDSKLDDFPENFSSKDHERIQEEFRKIDEELLKNKRSKIMTACNLNRPRGAIGFGSTINREKEKKRRHKPIRKMIDEGFDFIQSLKPCIMMSPLSVSSYLPARAAMFDVVIFDEASQIHPEEAINCIYRSKQVIIAGDQKQLPPTSFFRAMDDDDDDYEEEVADFESLLDIAKAGRGIKSMSLKWHYRSQHEDLITFSNNSFYESELYTFPSSKIEHPLFGITHTRVDGIYARGGSRDNEIEANEVYRRVEELVKNDPELTIGVVAFSGSQMKKIEQVIEAKRRDHPIMDEWFATHESRLDGFFVKNIENVQGDERDVIIFSTGYGKDSNGKFTQNFGPLSRDTGWRRLNVAVTRARKKLEVITSIDPTWIKSTSTSVLHFKKFLEYAEKGPEVFEIDLTDSLGDADSPFEEEVIRVIRGWGYDVVPQVGCASYRIDMGVLHPSHEGNYCLAIECDGAMYHSSRVARDRDRLREQVLRNLGWDFHRIWGTTWYRENERARDSLKDAIERAASRAPLQISKKKNQKPEPEVLTEEVGADPIIPDVHYERVLLRKRDHRASDYSHGIYDSWKIVQRQITTIVEAEGPIHRELLYERIRDSWMMKNATSKLKKYIDRMANQTSVAYDDSDFFWKSSSREITRYRNVGLRRDSKHVAKEEVALVFQKFYSASRNSIGKNELQILTVNFFGWGKRTSKVTRKLDEAMEYWGKGPSLGE